MSPGRSPSTVKTMAGIEVLMGRGDIVRIEDGLYLHLDGLDESVAEASFLDPSVRCNWNFRVKGHFHLEDNQGRTRKKFELEVSRGRSPYGYVHVFKRRKYIIRSSGKHDPKAGAIGVMIQ